MVKEKFYKNIVRPAMMYRSECWAIIEKEKLKIIVAEIKMQIWICDVTRLNRIRNEYLRGSLGVANKSQKMKENRLKWFGYVEAETMIMQTIRQVK